MNYAQLIDPEWATRLLLRANEDDEEAAIRRQQPSQMPQAGGMEDAFQLRGRGGIGTQGAIAPSGEGSNQEAIGGGGQAAKRVSPNRQAMPEEAVSPV